MIGLRGEESSANGRMLMRQDAKLGLALGMLVIGFAIAFCFPRAEDLTAWQSQSTTHTTNHNFIPIRAYQPEPTQEIPVPEIVVDGQLRREAQTINAQLPPPVQPITHDLKLHSGSNVSLADILKVEATELTPPSVMTLPGEEPIPTITIKSPHMPVTFNGKTYQVQPGDTLTGIAYRTLGSSSRYRELYEANRDVLASPDDLRVGLLLQIPGDVGPSTIVIQSEDAPQLAEETEQDRKLFGRPSTTPFLSEKSDSSATNSPVQHRVQPGDTLEGISLKYYHDPRGVLLIQEANPTVDPSRLKLGMELEIPVRR